METRFSFNWKNNGTQHNDLILHVGEYTHQCDSYYFALDSAIRPDDESASKVAEVLKLLLTYWIGAVEKIPEGGQAFLPYDFSDQCTAWLRVARADTLVRIQPGWSAIEGYSFFPSAPGNTSPRDFAPIETAPPLEISLSNCVQAIRRSIAQLQAP